MIRYAVLLAPLLMSACVYGDGAAPPLPPLAEDQSQPAAALVEHVLTRYFARVPATAETPTVCASVAPTPLEDGQEKSLIARFQRLAPRTRCTWSASGPVDAITAGPAVVIEIYDFACSSASVCTGWATVPGEPSARYGMRWQNGAWQFARDARLIAE